MAFLTSARRDPAVMLLNGGHDDFPGALKRPPALNLLPGIASNRSGQK
jgi:hypothetical protein